MITVADAAKKYPLSKSLLYELCRTGKLVHYRVGTKGRGKIILKEEDVERLLAACRREGPQDDDGDEVLTFLK